MMVASEAELAACVADAVDPLFDPGGRYTRDGGRGSGFVRCGAVGHYAL